jgi:hypothetical protein
MTAESKPHTILCIYPERNSKTLDKMHHFTMIKNQNIPDMFLRGFMFYEKEFHFCRNDSDFSWIVSLLFLFTGAE